ncbi:hypothetical protein MCOR25_010342 [Pyricularia grisea]|nr:hypothetical protein MCOR25_010342 [Pyricularia grisea]
MTRAKAFQTPRFYFVAANPDLRDWICEQLASVDPAENKVYMNENLRLHPPLSIIYTSFINPGGEDLVIDGRTVHIPPKTLAVPNITTATTSPKFWDSQRNTSWRLRRLIDPATKELRNPSRRCRRLLPLCGGPTRPHRKEFAQVEFVVILSALLTGLSD